MNTSKHQNKQLSSQIAQGWCEMNYELAKTNGDKLRRGLLRGFFPSLCWMNREVWEFSYSDFADPTPVANTDGAVFEIVPPIHESST